MSKKQNVSDKEDPTMRKVKIVTDSCADLNAEQLQKYDIAFARMSTSCDGVGGFVMDPPLL